ncbi:sulfotransferase family protein [Nocardia takedensis]
MYAEGRTDVIQIQMIGTQRSGSNLLRLMLNAGGSILAPPSAHELRDMLRFSALYEPLDNTRNRIRLAADIITLVRANALEWPEDHLDEIGLLSHLTGNTLTHFVLALYDQAAIRSGRVGWINKCLENAHYFAHLEVASSDLLYLHLVRDPRDVALSFENAPIGPKDPRVIALQWSKDQQVGRAITTRFPERSYTLRFEDLVRTPEASLEDLSNWLGFPHNVAAFDYYKRSDAVRAATLSPLWSNLSSAPISERADAYARRGERADFIEQVEELICDDMKVFGYEPAYATSTRTLSGPEIASAFECDVKLRAESEKAHFDRDQSIHTRRDDLLEKLAGELRDRGIGL